MGLDLGTAGFIDRRPPPARRAATRDVCLTLPSPYARVRLTVVSMKRLCTNVFIIMNFSDSDYCAKKLRQTHGAASHRFLSRIDICADP